MKALCCKWWLCFKLQTLYFPAMKRVPNILSASRIVLAPLFVLLYLQDDIVWTTLSVAVFAVAAVTDYFDGYIARVYGAGSKLGVFLDPLADKFLTIAGFVCLPFVDPQQFPWWAIIAIIFRDVFVTGLRFYTDRQGLMMATSFLAKVKTFAQMVFLYVALLTGVFIGTDVFLSSWFEALLYSHFLEYGLYAVTFITVYTGVEYVVTNRKQLFHGKDA